MEFSWQLRMILIAFLTYQIPLLHEKFEPFKTYLISGARVQPSNPKYERALHKFEWVIDKKTIIDPVNEDTPDETVLPLPQKLYVVPLKDIKNYSNMNAEIDIVASVVNCFPPKYTKGGKILQELMVVDLSHHQDTVTFTLWGESIIEDEGKKIMEQFKSHPIILARRVTISTFYGGISLMSRFNTSILINPPYPLCQELKAWAVGNKELLESFNVTSTSKSGFLIPRPIDEEITDISNVQSIRDGHTFSVEAKVSIPNQHQPFYVLACSNCGQELRFELKRAFNCNNCNTNSLLIPRCRFEVELEDTSGTTTGMISGKEAEKILSLTAEQIYEMTQTNKESLPMQDVQNRLDHAVFKLQARKSYGKLFIQSCVRTENALNALPAPTLVDAGEGSKRKKEQLFSSDGEKDFPAKHPQSLKMKQKLEPRTPVKMQ